MRIMLNRDRGKSHQNDGQEKTGCYALVTINTKIARSRKVGQGQKIMMEGEAETLKTSAQLRVNCKMEECFFFQTLSEYKSEKSKNVHSLHNHSINKVNENQLQRKAKDHWLNQTH